MLHFLTNPELMRGIAWAPILLTLKIAVCATFFATVVGVALGWLFTHRRFSGQSVVEALLMLPLVLPPTVLGYYLLVVLGRDSWVGQWLAVQFDYSVIFHWHGAVVAATLAALPLVVRGSQAAFARVETTLENAARTLGLSEWQVFYRITLPLATSGIIASMLLAFARALGEFGATLMVAGNIAGRTQTMSMAIYDAVQTGDDLTAVGLTAILSAICVVLMVLVNGFTRRTRHQVE